ncbi:hypothetical protein [Paenibacillus thalictri]|uniref:Photosynthesis system II assembly factor Ycf48/Hcf136-like domain-containing protein n=1 Tax=Paenibacillus thalictri TaxID=2527873 RepID=A0A4Q9DTS3_9BACL|nr:hypothetical protein [Paenibacillus thalictri]TBL78607.1 hypothetical protein EYB31_13985 [Paenibacillus thalictri]
MIRKTFSVLAVCALFAAAGCSGSGSGSASQPSGPAVAVSGATADSASTGGQPTSPGASAAPAGQTAADGGKTASPVSQNTDAPNSPSRPASENTPMSEVTAVRIIDPASGWTGGNGWIARTDNGGKAWAKQYEGKESIKQLFALNGKEVWSVTGNGGASGTNAAERLQLLHSTDGGKKWSSAGTVPNGGFLHFVSSQEGFAANAHTIDGGKSWEQLTVPSPIVGDAYFHDKKNGWAVAADNGKLLVKRTTDGGATWQNVMSRDSAAPVNGALIRSAGVNDAWIEVIGDSGMSQTSYSLFHTPDGGKSWVTVIANSTAGAGPAPGFPAGYNDGPKNNGSKPGMLYVVDTNTAFMSGFCPACDKPNTVGWTHDGGKTWNNGTESFGGFGGSLLAMADSNNGWMITTDRTEPSIMYTTSDGGKHWTEAHKFDKPKPSAS